MQFIKSYIIILCFLLKRRMFYKVKGNVSAKLEIQSHVKVCFKNKLSSFPKKRSAALKDFDAICHWFYLYQKHTVHIALKKYLVAGCHSFFYIWLRSPTILPSVIIHHSLIYSLFSKCSVRKTFPRDRAEIQNSCLPYSKPMHYKLRYAAHSFAYNLFSILFDDMIMMMECLCACRWGPTCCWAGCLRGWPAGARAGG